MSYELNEGQQELRNRVRTFVRTQCTKEVVHQWDMEGKIPTNIHHELKNLGIMGLSVPRKFGGLGGNATDYVIVIEELAKACMSLAFYYIMGVVYGGEVINDCGSEYQKVFFLPKIAEGELFFSYGITEPDAGSDAGACRTLATSSGDNYIINGTKMFITGADFSDYCVTLTRTDDKAKKHKGLTVFIVDTKCEGYTANPIKKLGVRASSACEVVFENVKVPKENILGGPDGLHNGWALLLKTLDLEHIEVAAASVGAGKAALDDVLDYVKQNIKSGASIDELQAVRHTVAEMSTDLECARLLTYHAASLKSRHLDCWKESCMAKLFASEACKKIALKGMEIFRGEEYLIKTSIQRHVRDTIAGTVGGGTSEIQKNMIAKALGV